MRFAKVEPGRADEIADVLDEDDRPFGGGEMLDRMPDHMGIEMTALAGVDLDGGGAGGADARRIVGGLLVALDHKGRNLALQLLDGPDQKFGLARAGARNQVQRQNAAFTEIGAVTLGQGIVLGQKVAFHRQHAAFRIVAVMMVVVVIVVMVMAVAMLMIVMAVGMTVAVFMAFDRHFTFAAAAGRTHQLTSNSLIRRASPPLICSSVPPHLGQGESRSLTVTSSKQLRQRASAGSVTISSLAPSAKLPRITTSKPKRRASGSTEDSGPTSSVIRFTFSNLAVSASDLRMSSRLSHSDISCIG